ncbi:hypothetical protein IE81DRAFT_346340 [Ceraceosorus guamensis]|uniref:BSD domain-containing protein n=1 Tax=Ceraceosorus guamensis TaxID=1522189 RepID=A0A316W1W8_9BASI|nr:hypothetical protein IE81DRAFT_346340 [Ceraceosorus guamensis]PWN43742.1 hypothetical protein IE81DRAFT_346340 [Ceraceosorus guamensis]
MDVTDAHFYSTSSATMSLPAASATDGSRGKDESGSEANQTAQSVGAEPTLEQEVSQLVGSLGSWWTGVSKRSQDTLASARKQIDAQGGLMAMARAEAAKLEAQLNEAQKAAREKAQVPLEASAEGETTSGNTSNKGKGKAKALDDDSEKTDSGRDFDGEQYSEMGEALPIPKGSQRSQAGSTGLGTPNEELFDADSDSARGRADVKDNRLHQRTATTDFSQALGSAQAWFTRVQGTLVSEAQPRVLELQKSLASTLSSLSGEGNNVGAKDETREKSEQSSTASLAAPSEALPALTKTFQQALPHLDWKASQDLAKKYYAASENLARDVGKEMSALVGDLVKVVPANEVSQKGDQDGTPQGDNKLAQSTPVQPESASSSKSKTGQNSSSQNISDDFDWDAEAEEASAQAQAQAQAHAQIPKPIKTDTIAPSARKGMSASSSRDSGLQTTTGPQTSSWEAEEQEEDARALAVASTKKEESGEDSDWE